MDKCIVKKHKMSGGIKMKKMLIADHIEMNRSILSEVFAQEYEIITTESSSEVFKLLTNGENFSVVLMGEDIAGKLSGDEIRTLSKMKVFETTALILILESYCSTERIVRSELEFHDVTASPVNPTVIRRRVENVCELLSRRNGTQESIDDRDTLTGLWNFIGARKNIEKLISENEKSQRHMMMLIDIDGFSSINRRTGYRFGNEILKDIGQMLRRHMPPECILGRIEDDNYIVFVPDCSVKEGGMPLIEDAFRSIHKTYTFNGITYPEVTASIGITEYPTHGISFDELFACASKAVDVAKINGKNMYLFYNANMKTGWDMAEGAGSAITDQAPELQDEVFETFFMPVKDYRSGRILHCEMIESTTGRPDNYDFDAIYSAIYHSENITAVSLNSLRRQFSRIYRLEQEGAALPHLSISTMFRGSDSEIVLKALDEILTHYPVNCKNITISITQDMLDDMDAHSITGLVEFLKLKGFGIGIYLVGFQAVNTKCFAAGLFDSITFAGRFLDNVGDGAIPPEVPVYLTDCFTGLGMQVIMPMNSDPEILSVLGKKTNIPFGIYSGEMIGLDELNGDTEDVIRQEMPVLEYNRTSLVLSDRIYDEILEQTRSFIFEWTPRLDSVKFSGSFERMYGYKPSTQDFLRDLRSSRLLHPDDMSCFIGRLNYVRSEASDAMCLVRFYNMMSDQYVWNRVHFVVARNTAGIPARIVVVCADITDDRVRDEDELRRERTDYICSMYKRSASENKIRSFLREEGAAGQHALIIAEINGFERIETALGRVFASAVVRGCAEDISELFRDSDIIGRISGAQYILFVKNCGSLDELKNKAPRICEIIEKSYSSDEESVSISGKVGVSLFPKDGRTYEEMFSAALNALYFARHSINTNFAFSYETEPVRRITAESTDRRNAEI